MVQSALDTHNPPVSLRGTIEIHTQGTGKKVGIVVDYPEGSPSATHRQTLWLSDEEVSVLRASERNGALQFATARAL